MTSYVSSKEFAQQGVYHSLHKAQAPYTLDLRCHIGVAAKIPEVLPFMTEAQEVEWQGGPHVLSTSVNSNNG
jgi:hypothetical protein